MFFNPVSRRAILPTLLVLLHLSLTGTAAAATAPPAPGMAPLSAGTIYSTLKRAKVKPSTLMGNSAYTQSFVSQITSYPTDLNVRFGADKMPNTVRLRIAVNGAEVFDHTYADLLETPIGTTFDLRQFPRKILNGDIVSFSIAPSAIVTRIDSAAPDDPTAPQGTLADGRTLLAQFAMMGATAPDARAFEPVVLDPAIFGSNMIDPAEPVRNSTQHAFSFRQEFVALQTGVPTELGVNMFKAMAAKTDTVYDCDLEISINGKRVYSRLISAYNVAGSAMTVFPLNGFIETIKAGDRVSFYLGPRASVGFYLVTNPRVGIGQSTIDGGARGSARFYMKK